MKNEIGIAIIDLFGQNELDECLNSILKLNFDTQNLFIVSPQNNNFDKNIEHKKITTFVPLATLRNFAISKFRTKNLKYFFIVNSNCVVKNQSLLDDVISLAKTFGVWFLTGPDKRIQIVEDDSKLELNISSQINSNFIFLNYGIVKNFGYFDEKYCNGEQLDVIDYIIRLRNKNVYPTEGYYPTINADWIETKKLKIKINGFCDYNEDFDQSVKVSYGHFMYNHKYLPLENRPPRPVDEFLSSMDNIQKNYSKK